MTKITFKGTPLELAGNFLQAGQMLPNFSLVQNNLEETSALDYKGKFLILSIFPSLDTPVCSMGVKRFNQEAAKLPNTQVLCISKDLPFAQSQFCATANIKNVKTLSAFRNKEFGRDFGVDINSGPLQGLFARAVIITDPNHKVIYSQLVPEVSDDINYEPCLAAIAYAK